MKNLMADVRDHLVAQLERLGDDNVTADDLARAKAVSELVQTFTNTVKVEVEARKAAGLEHELPPVLLPRKLPPLEHKP